jgi:hypothetical protein
MSVFSLDSASLMNTSSFADRSPRSEGELEAVCDKLEEVNRARDALIERRANKRFTPDVWLEQHLDSAFLIDMDSLKDRMPRTEAEPNAVSVKLGEVNHAPDPPIEPDPQRHDRFNRNVRLRQNLDNSALKDASSLKGQTPRTEAVLEATNTELEDSLIEPEQQRHNGFHPDVQLHQHLDSSSLTNRNSFEDQIARTEELLDNVTNTLEALKRALPDPVIETQR